MGKFDGMLICTDLDGTLLRNDKSISDENIKAIEYFKQEGGLFTFVTGRMPFVVYDVLNKIKPNAPFGCINGGGIYDWENDKYLWTANMPEGVTELVRHIDESFDDVGIQINTFYKICFSRDNEAMQNFRKRLKMDAVWVDYNEMTEPIAKIIFGSEREEVIKAIEEKLNSHPRSDEFEFIRSERTLYEILPKGISKGTSITKLCQYLNLDNNKTIAIGDYNNDIPMFREAGISIAVSNACEAARAEADFVTVSNEENAIARVIYDLENGAFQS